MFDSLANVLNHKPRRQLYEAARVVFVAQKVVGEGRKVVAYRNRNLTVMVKSSTAAVKLKSESEELVNRIDLSLGSQAIDKIKIKVGD